MLILIYLFLKNQIQRTIGSGYFKTLKESTVINWFFGNFNYFERTLVMILKHLDIHCGCMLLFLITAQYWCLLTIILWSSPVWVEFISHKTKCLDSFVILMWSILISLGCIPKFIFEFFLVFWLWVVFLIGPKFTELYSFQEDNMGDKV